MSKQAKECVCEVEARIYERAVPLDCWECKGERRRAALAKLGKGRIRKQPLEGPVRRCVLCRLPIAMLQSSQICNACWRDLE